MTMIRRFSIRKNRSLAAIAAMTIIVAAGLVTYALIYRHAQNAKVDVPESPADISDQSTPEPSFVMSAMGDMLAHDSVVQQAKTADGYDFSPYFASITPLLQNSDVIFCNPETTSAGAEYGISGYPTFNAPTEFARDLRKAGCDVINLASNHISDKGQAALHATLDVWEAEKPLAIAGANRSADEQHTVQYFEKNGLKVAFLAFADFSNGPVPYDYSLNSYHDEALVRQLMKEAREQADAVIVSMHWGAEDSHEVNEDQQAAAQLLANLGADVIIGTGPHVLQPVRWVEGEDGHKTLVWYSIGNMLSSQLQIDELTGGVATFRLVKQESGVVISDIRFAGTFMSYEWNEADRQAQILETRRNLTLRPLADAEADMRYFDTTLEDRKQSIRAWLGDDVDVTITP